MPGWNGKNMTWGWGGTQGSLRVTPVHVAGSRMPGCPQEESQTSETTQLAACDGGHLGTSVAIP